MKQGSYRNKVAIQGAGCIVTVGEHLNLHVWQWVCTVLSVADLCYLAFGDGVKCNTWGVVEFACVIVQDTFCC